METTFTTVHELWQTLVRASVDRKHPWRVVGLSTQGPQGPSSRSVILRKVLPAQRQLVFFTDARTAKIADLAHCERLALLFWNPQHSLQLRIAASAVIETDADTIEAYWNLVPPHAQRDYGSVDAPGSVLLHGDTEDQLDVATARQHFTVLYAIADSLDVLHLTREKHTRSRHVWSVRTGTWQSDAVVP